MPLATIANFLFSRAPNNLRIARRKNKHRRKNDFLSVQFLKNACAVSEMTFSVRPPHEPRLSIADYKTANLCNGILDLPTKRSRIPPHCPTDRPRKATCPLETCQ